jgi:integrase
LFQASERGKKVATLANALDAILADYAISGKKTAQRVKQSFAHLSAHFGTETDLAGIGYSQLLAYTRKRMEGSEKEPKAAGSTVRNELIALKRGFHLLEIAGEAKCPPFPTIRLNNVRKGFFEDGQFREVCRLLPGDLAPYMQFLFLTGWRADDARRLTWNANVDLVGGMIRVDPGETKCGEGRCWPFAVLNEFRTLILDQLRDTKGMEIKLGRVIPWVFWRYPDARQVGDYRKAWKTACRKAGLPGRLVHDLCRTAARRFDQSGMSRSVSMDLMGRATESIFDRYNIVIEADLINGVKKLEEKRKEARDENEKGKA